jgi:hypothetical protein
MRVFDLRGHIIRNGLAASRAPRSTDGRRPPSPTAEGRILLAGRNGRQTLAQAVEAARADNPMEGKRKIAAQPSRPSTAS